MVSNDLYHGNSCLKNKWGYFYFVLGVYYSGYRRNMQAYPKNCKDWVSITSLIYKSFSANNDNSYGGSAELKFVTVARISF